VQITNTEQTGKTDPLFQIVGFRVTDGVGNAIAGASVTIVSQESGQSWEAVTDGNGLARLEVPRSGNIILTARASGFNPWQVDIKVPKEQIRIILYAGATTGLVEVSSSSAGVATEDVPFESNLRQFLEPLAMVVEAGPSGAERNSGGTATPVMAGQAGQPHVVVQLKVTDPVGAVLRGARVILRDQNSNLQWGGVTDSKGGFSMPFLPLGVYMLTVEMSGLAAYSNIIEASDSGWVNLQVQLQSGAITGVVVVNHVRPAPIDVGSSVRTTFNLSDQ